MHGMNNKKTINSLKIIAIPTAYALIMRFVFGVKDWEGAFKMMSVTFLFLLPCIVGMLTVYFSRDRSAGKLVYRIFAPWIPVLVFFLITFVLAIEGWPCLVMILPVFLIAASLGGTLGGYLKSRKRDNNVQVSLLVLLPLVISPIEHAIGVAPKEYRAYTYIDIHAPANKIWPQVTQVGEILPLEDRGKLTRFLGFPRPIKAELNYEGVGAYREAIFENGLVFHETVTAYEKEKRMSFSISALPHEIPITTLDEHLVIGGKYFDVLNGTYELEKLNDTTYRLHLYSHFKLTTTFNFYASWWALLIMKDIQNNILQIEKRRAELH